MNCFWKAVFWNGNDHVIISKSATRAWTFLVSTYQYMYITMVKDQKITHYHKYGCFYQEIESYHKNGFTNHRLD